LVGGVTLVLSLVSANVAYRTGRERIGPLTLQEVAAGREEVATALRARRGTAAAYAAAYSVLFLAIVLGPYRRGERWCWWAILAGAVVLAALSLARLPLLGAHPGTGTAAVQLGIVVLALFLDVGRLRSVAG
jgi:hypothetical protein